MAHNNIKFKGGKGEKVANLIALTVFDLNATREERERQFEKDKKFLERELNEYDVEYVGWTVKHTSFTMHNVKSLYVFVTMGGKMVLKYA